MVDPNNIRTEPHRIRDGVPNITERTPEEQFAIRSAGGKKVTDRQRFAAKFKWVKKRVRQGRLEARDEAWLVERMINPGAFAYDLLDFFDEIRRTCVPEENIKLLNTGMKLYDTIHNYKDDRRSDEHHQVLIQINSGQNSYPQVDYGSEYEETSVMKEVEEESV